MRILLVEDEKRLAAALAQLLKDNHYLADVAHDGESGLDLALTDSYDALVLDIMLPKRSGLDVVREIRGAGMNVPILLLTARDTVDDRVAGLDAGADDYLVKPFNNRELLARVRALTRRSANLTPADSLAVEPFVLDRAQRVVKRGEEPLSMTSKEFQLMELFMRNPGKVLAKELILDRIWGPDASVIANAVENYIHFLRKKIDIPNQPSYIETVRGVGYIFRVPNEDA